MSEQLPKQAPTNKQVIIFVVILSFACALILSVLASALQGPQEVAKELDRSEQLMIAAKIFTHEGYFLIEKEKGEYIPAKYSGDGILVPGSESDIASQNEILDVYKKRIEAKLLSPENKIVTFEEAGINKDDYIAQHKKSGYYRQPYKLIYEVMPNPKKGEGEAAEKPVGYVIPVNGFGLWDAIYGFLAVEPDGVTVIGISWYDQKETPGLGANIADAPWQNNFPGKLIFQPTSTGEVNPNTAPIGITVVKGKVSETLGDSPKARAAVDGMPGATLTGNGVTSAYRDVLSAYRPFFVTIHDESEQTKG